VQDYMIQNDAWPVDTIAVHHWAGTWWGKSQAFLFERKK